MAGRTGPGSLRRRTGLVLAWLGAFMLGTGIMLRTYVYDHVAVLPVNVYAVTTLHATGATYFDPSVLRTRTGLNVTATSTLRGDALAATGDTGVYDTFLAVRATDGTPIKYVQTRAALDRHTGLLVDCCGANVGGDSSVRESGLSFKFPFFARKTSYPMFDTDVLRTVPATYAGQTSIDGMLVYRYVQVLPTSQIGQRQVPPSIMGMRPWPALITVRSLEATTMTFWADPVTGAPVKVEENTRQFLRTANGRHTRLAFAADFKQNPADVAAAVDRYRSQSSQLTLVHGPLPLGSVIFGAALLVIGALLVYGSRSKRGSRARQAGVAAGSAAGVGAEVARIRAGDQQARNT